MRLCILIADSNGGYPVPATKGGAVSTLVEHIIKENDEKQLIDLTIVSFYDKNAEQKANKQYSNVCFLWVKRPVIVRCLDYLIMKIVKIIFPSKKLVSFMSIASLLWYIWQASRIIKNNRIDKLILQNNIPLSWTIRLSNYRGEYYYHLHNIPRTNAMCQSVFRHCSAYLCVSRYVGDEICNPQNAIGPVPQEKIRVLYNCIDTHLFKVKEIDKSSWQKRFNIKECDKVIVFVGRLSEEKGVDQLLLALDNIKSENIKVLIVGSLIYNNNIRDSYQEKIKNLAIKFGSKVTFTGYICQQELPDLYNLADISVLPSMWDEPAGLTMIESLACGTPVITTRSGGIPEYVDEGAVVLERNEKLPVEIAKNIDLLLSNEKMYQEYLWRGLERVKTHFGNNGYLGRFIKTII